MGSYHLNYTRFVVGEYVYYSMRGWTCGDDTPAEIRRGAFQIIRNWLNRGKTLDDVLHHIDGLAMSARLA